MSTTDTSVRRFHPAVRIALLRYVAYRILRNAGFATPFVVVFLVGRGVTYTDIGLGTSAMAAVTIVTEVPSGYVADRFGRRTTILVGQVFGALAATGYLFARSTAGIVVLYVAFGLTASLQSGSALAWFYDVLKEHEAEERYTEIVSRLGSVVRLVTAATMLGGALLFVVDPALAIVAGAVANWLCIAVVATFPRNADYGEEVSLGIREATDITREFVTNSSVRTVVAVGALYWGATYAASKYVQPTTLDVVPATGLLVAGVPVPPPVVLALVYAAYSAASGVVVGYGDDAEDLFGVGGAVLLAYGAGAVCMIIPSALPAVALPALVGFMSLPMLAEPAVGAYLNERTGSLARATVMSAVSFVRAAVRIPILLTGGVLADVYSPVLAMGAIGATVLGVGSLVVALDRPVVARSAAVPDAAG